MRLASLVALLLGAASSLACGSNVVVDGAGGASSVTTMGTTSTVVTGTGAATTGSSPPPLGCPGAGNPVGVDAPGCPCTRRTGSSGTCPAGTGATVTMAIGPSGGSISLAGNQGTASGVPMELDFPPMALLNDTEITITETDIPPPFAYEDWSPVWKFDPIGVVLHVPVQMKMPDGSDQTQVPSLVVYWSADGCTWSPLSDGYNNAGFMNASTLGLGYGFVGVQKPPAQASCP